MLYDVQSGTAAASEFVSSNQGLDRAFLGHYES